VGGGSAEKRHRDLPGREPRCHAYVVERTSLLVASFLTLSCQASVQGDASVDTESGADADLEAEVQTERSTDPSASGTVTHSLTGPSGARTLLGARRDLTLAPGEGAPACTCVKVALGAPTSSAFKWKAAPPAIDPERQLVIALTSEGAGCPDPKGGKGASYWGYGRSGDNIIVYVETAIKDRPVASGAIIPKPFGSGEVFLAPKGGAPYGKPASGKGTCKVGNPGKPRTVPVAEDELGDVYFVAESDS
jgi:hypothetical protein